MEQNREAERQVVLLERLLTLATAYVYRSIRDASYPATLVPKLADLCQVENGDILASMDADAVRIALRRAFIPVSAERRQHLHQAYHTLLAAEQAARDIEALRESAEKQSSQPVFADGH